MTLLVEPNQPNIPNPMAQGVYTDPNTGFFKDKFGYNVGPTILQSNFLQPGSSSFRSYALQGLRGLDRGIAEDFYQTNYGKSFEDVKKDIQQKKNPFGPQDPNIGTSDYQGGGGGGGNIQGEHKVQVEQTILLEHLLIMAKIVQVLTRPSKEYDLSTAEAQVRDLDAIVEKLNSTFQEELKQEVEAFNFFLN